MTDRLYDRRVATYPALFAAAAAFRRSKMAGAEDLKEHLRDALIVVDEVHAGEVGLLLSARGHRCLLELRHAVKAVTEDVVSKDELEGATERIWRCKNDLRGALRADLGLLFDEEAVANGEANITG